MTLINAFIAVVYVIKYINHSTFNNGLLLDQRISGNRLTGKYIDHRTYIFATYLGHKLMEIGYLVYIVKNGLLKVATWLAGLRIRIRSDPVILPGSGSESGSVF